MLANKATVKAFVDCFADMQGNGIYRRTWCDKTKVSDEQRLLTFRFWDKAEADTVAQRLQAVLNTGGWTNKVKRTSVETDWMGRSEGGEYVRVRVMFE